MSSLPQKGNDKLEHSALPKNTMKIHENWSCRYDEHSVVSVATHEHICLVSYKGDKKKFNTIEGIQLSFNIKQEIFPFQITAKIYFVERLTHKLPKLNERKYISLLEVYN